MSSIDRSVYALRLFLILLLATMALSTSASATITYVQGNKEPHLPASSVALTLSAAQSAGNLNVVVIGWNDVTSHVVSVTDTKGNAYSIATGPIAASGAVTSVIYYAQNIAAATANGNTITVTFDGLVTPDIRVAEYGGISTTNALDVAVSNSGVGTALSSGSVATTNANDLLVGASSVSGWVQGPGSGYTQRIMTDYGNILQDRIVTTTGSYTATTSQDINDWWVMQLVAFRAASGGSISYVQEKHFTGTADQIVTATYTAAQAAGDLNVVAVGWYINSLPAPTVTDTKGNTYSLAAVRTASGNSATSLIYYAKNIAAATANSNKVTIRFAGLVPYPDVRIAEYSGIDTTNPLDVQVSNSGVGTAVSSGSITTTNANDLLIGAATLSGYPQGPGSGYTQRVLTDYSNILEDKIVTSTGSYSATTSQDINDYWVMQMVAFKAASSGGDTTAPTAPTGLTATAASSTQINLSWAASTDNVGVTGYRIERCSGASCSTFAQIATPTATTYSDTGLTASTSYSYRVRATDAATNLSAYSSTASATTSAAADTTPPTAPTGLTVTVTSSTQINLSWTASTDAVGVTGYLVERCTGASCSTFAQIATPSTTTYSDTGLTGSTSYSYRVRARDAANNLSTYSSTASGTTQAPPDTTAPSAPTGLTATAASSTQINLSWTASTDAVGVTGYRIERCSGASCSTFAQVATPTTTTYSDTGLTASTSYSYRVRATDAAGNLSSYSSTASATTSAAADTTAPTAPTGLTATAASSTQINLSWTASTDAVGVTGYRVERCSGASCSTFAQVATPTTTTYSDTGLTASTSYSYRVRATDAAGNLSSYSSTASASTQAPPDTTAPTAPSGLTATAASATQINLSWTASTDAVGVTGYRIERCAGASCSTFAQIATPTTTTYSDTGLTASTSYSYRVRATDAAGNLSTYSSTASATTGALPSTPTGLSMIANSKSEIDLAWSAASGGAGVTGYRLERCQGVGCGSFAQIAAPTTLVYYDMSLSAATSYSYRVRAIDTVGNLSGYSSVLTVTTLGAGSGCD